MACENDWTYEKDEMLIELVKTKPGLYDFRTPHYSDNNYKRNVWDEIGKAVGADDAKTRWETLRLQYRTYLGKLNTKSDQAASKVAKWRLMDQMNFLMEFVRTYKDRSASISHEDVELDVEVLSERDSETSQQEQQSPASTNSPPLKRKKRMRKTREQHLVHQSATSTLMEYLLKKKEEDSAPPHPIDQFFSLMAMTVKKFSPRDQHLVKAKVFSLVSDIERKYLFQPSESYIETSAFSENLAPSSSPNFPQYPSEHSFPLQQYPTNVPHSRSSTPQIIP